MPRSLVPVLFCVMMVAAIFPPFVPLAGPLSLDDLLPVAAVLLGFAVIPFSDKKLTFDATAIGFALLALTSLISNAANAETLSDFLRFSGRSTGRIIYYQALLLGTRAILDRNDWSRRALGFLVAAATIESVFCIFAFATKYRGPYGLGMVTFPDWSVLTGQIRVQGTFSGAVLRYEGAAVSPNFLAAYLLLSIPVTVGLMATVRGSRRAAFAAAGLLQVATLYLTYTRAALAAFGFGILAMGFLAGRRRLAAGALIIAVVAALSIPTLRTKIFSEGHDRWSLYWASLRITDDHAVFGVGDGNYEQVLHENQKYHETPYGIATTTSHNSVLLTAASHGLAGGGAHVLLYLLLIGAVLRNMREVRDPENRVLVAGVIAGIIGFLAQDQMNNLTYVPKVATQMWFLYALVAPLARMRAADLVDDPRVVRLYRVPAVNAKGVDHSHP